MRKAELVRPSIAVIFSAVLAACTSGATDGFENLPDGSYLYAVPYRGGPLIEGSRCWAKGRTFVCIALKRFDAPTFLVTRYATTKLDTSTRSGQRFGCLFEPTSDEWFRQLIGRKPISAQTDAMLARSISRVRSEEGWSRSEAITLLRENGGSAADYLDCRAIQEFVLTNGVQGLLDRELEISQILGRSFSADQVSIFQSKRQLLSGGLITGSNA